MGDEWMKFSALKTGFPHPWTSELLHLCRNTEGEMLISWECGDLATLWALPQISHGKPSVLWSPDCREDQLGKEFLLLYKAVMWQAGWVSPWQELSLSLKERDPDPGPSCEGAVPFNVGRGNVDPPGFPLQAWWERQLNGAVGEKGSRQEGQGSWIRGPRSEGDPAATAGTTLGAPRLLTLPPLPPILRTRAFPAQVRLLSVALSPHLVFRAFVSLSQDRLWRAACVGGGRELGPPEHKGSLGTAIREAPQC